MKVIFYKGRKTLFSHAIFWFQMWKLRKKIKNLNDREKVAQYTHVEAFFDNKVMYSSSERDKGVRGRYMPKLSDSDEKSLERWDFVELNLSKEAENTILKWFESKDGLKYDRVGIAFAQVLNTNWFLQEDKWFCSEIVTAALQEVGLQKLRGVAPHMVSPADLYLLLTK